MSYDRDDSSGLNAVAVAVLLLLLILGSLGGLGFLYFTRQRAEVAQILAMEQQARAEAEAARAEALRAAELKALKPADSSATNEVTIAVDADGAIHMDEQTLDMPQLIDKVSEQPGAAVVVIVAPNCPTSLLGELSRRCLDAGAATVSLRPELDTR